MIEKTLILIHYLILFKYQSDHIWSKNTQIISHIERDVKDWSSNIIANDATLAYDLADIKPHPHLGGHQTIQQSFLNCELFEATSLSTLDYFFQALNSCRDLSRGWRNQLNPGIVPKCGQSRLRVSHSSVQQRRSLLGEVTDELGHGSKRDVPPPRTAAECHRPEGPAAGPRSAPKGGLPLSAPVQGI